jgi:hypothetical protein
MIHRLKEDEKIVIFRPACFHRVAGPGLVMVLPIVDPGVKVNLTLYVPGWRGLPTGGLNERVRQLVMNASESDFKRGCS